MAHPPRSSWKSKRDRLMRSDFIGRSEQLTAFRASVTDPNAHTMIFAISGQGGVGKTTLLKEFRQITEESQGITAYVDEGSATNRVDDVPEAMYRLAKDFEAQNPNYKFEKFQERYKTYRQKRQELEADPEAPNGIASGIGRAGTKLVIGSVKAIPGVGEMMEEFIDGDAVAEKGGDLLSFAWKKFRNQDEVQLVTEPLEILTPLFLEELNRIADRQRVVLLIDTYEVTGAFLDDWLRAVLDLRYGDDLTDNFRLCIAGRDPLNHNAWATLEPCIVRSLLEPFTEEEARRFLTAKGVTSEAVINQIWSLSSGGLPLLVSMMAQNAPTSVNAVVDPCELAVERFLKWEMDANKKQLAQDGALPRVLNADIVAVLEDGQFDWLKGCAFVVRDKQRWRYHAVVREQMLRYHVQKSSKRWEEVHRKLAHYYDEKRQNLGLTANKAIKDQTWRQYSLEWLYHELCATPKAKLTMALNGFLSALKASRVFARQWAEVLAQAGQEAQCQTLKSWGNRLRDSMIAQKEKRYTDAIPALTALLAEAGIEAKLKAVALDWRGCWYSWSNQNELALKDLQQATEIDGEESEYWTDLAQTYRALKRYEEALQDFSRAIELDPEYTRAIAQRGVTYRLMERYEEALQDFSRAIELDPEYKWAITQRGETYRLMERYEEALKDFSRAIELDPEYKWAITQRGGTYGLMERYEEALKDFSRAIELDPEYKWAITQRGGTYGLMERYEEALQDFSRAIELDPEYQWAIAQRGDIYRLMKYYEEAFTDFNRSLELDPVDVWVQKRLGQLQYEVGIYADSQCSFQKALNLQPDNQMVASNLAYLHLLQGQIELAQDLLEPVIRNQPFDRAWLNHGLIQAQQGNAEAAQQSWQKGLSLMEDESCYEKAVRYVFTVALGNVAEGLEQMQALIASGADEFSLKNALNDATILSRSTQPIEGIEQIIQLLQNALSQR